MLAVGLTILPCAWLTDQPMPQAIFAMAGRFFATYAMNTGFQFSVEVIWAKPIRDTLPSQVLPTTLRGQGMAVVHLMSMVSLVASPLIVYSVSFFIMTPLPPLMTSTFSEQAVREGSLDHHITGCHNCQCPRYCRQSRKKRCLKTSSLSVYKQKLSSNDKLCNIIVCENTKALNRYPKFDIIRWKWLSIIIR